MIFSRLRMRQTALSRQKRRFSLKNAERHRLLPRAILVGVLSGAVAVGFHAALDMAEQVRDEVFRVGGHHGVSGAAGAAALAIAAVFIAAWLVRRFAREAGGSGIPHLKSVLHGDASIRTGILLPIKFLSGLIGIGGGLALGREGPTVQMGAAVGNAVAGGSSTTEAKDRSILIAAGGGAGLSAAFNAPLSGLVFVLEELQGRAASAEFFVAALACLSADMVSRITLGQFPVFELPAMETPELHLMPLFLMLGCVCGLFGVLFNKSILLATRVLAFKGSRIGRVGWWVVWALVIAAVGLFAPETLGSGQRFVTVIIDGHALAPVLILAYFIARFILTVGSYSTGAAGGIFSPILVLGALLGLALAEWAGTTFPSSGVEPRVFAIVGMAAYFTGVVRAPLTGIVLIIEMTGNYGLVLPLFVACLSAMMTADALHDLPIYEALLERDLSGHRRETADG